MTTLQMPKDVIADVVATPIALTALRPSPWNARKTLEPKSLAELAESIKQNGNITPLIVRPLDSMLDVLAHLKQAANSSRAYEIVAGWRRYNASKIAGRQIVPCFVRELSDDQARALGLIDNLQRQDVPPLEEADAYAELKQRLGTPAAIAAEVKKEVSYVARRLQLVSLAEMPRRALVGSLITIDHALLLARLGEGDQNEHLKWCLDTNAGIKTTVETVLTLRLEELKAGNRGRHFGYWEPQSVLDLKDHIESYAGRKLSRAPWKLDDAELVPAAGPCEGCPSNTKSNRTLFDDLTIDKATCANSACFESKRAAFVEIALGRAAEVGESEGVKISWKPSEAAPRMAKDGNGPNLTTVLRNGQWIEAKKDSCEHVRKAATVDWSNNDRWSDDDRKMRKPGEVLLVCVQPKCKKHAKSYETRAKRSNGGYDPKVEEAKREKKRQAALAETKIRVAVASAVIEKVTKLPAEVLRELVIRSSRGIDQHECIAILPGFEKKLKTAKVDSADFAKAAALVSLGSSIRAAEWSEPNAGRGELVAAAKRLGYANAADAWKQLVPKKPVAKPAKKAKPKGGKR